MRARAPERDREELRERQPLPLCSHPLAQGKTWQSGTDVFYWSDWHGSQGVWAERPYLSRLPSSLSWEFMTHPNGEGSSVGRGGRQSWDENRRVGI